jgi:hypothetical protein
MSYEERLLATTTHGIPAGYDAPPSGHLSYEEQLHVWCLLLKNKLAGKIAPAHPWDRRPTEYALLVPDKLAVAEVNAVSDIPITVDHLPSILARFRHLDPPYDDERKSSEPADPKAAVRFISTIKQCSTGASCANCLLPTVREPTVCEEVRSKSRRRTENRKAYQREWLRRKRSSGVSKSTQQPQDEAQQKTNE